MNRKKPKGDTGVAEYILSFVSADLVLPWYWEESCRDGFRVVVSDALDVFEGIHAAWPPNLLWVGIAASKRDELVKTQGRFQCIRQIDKLGPEFAEGDGMVWCQNKGSEMGLGWAGLTQIDHHGGILPSLILTEQLILLHPDHHRSILPSLILTKQLIHLHLDLLPILQFQQAFPNK